MKLNALEIYAHNLVEAGHGDREVIVNNERDSDYYKVDSLTLAEFTNDVYINLEFY